MTLGGQRDDSGPRSERAGSKVHGHFGFFISWGRASRSPWLVVPPASATPSIPLWGAPARTSPTPGNVPGWDQPATGLGRWESQPDSRTQSHEHEWTVLGHGHPRLLSVQLPRGSKDLALTHAQWKLVPIHRFLCWLHVERRLPWTH